VPSSACALAGQFLFNFILIYMQYAQSFYGLFMGEQNNVGGTARPLLFPVGILPGYKLFMGVHG
jgi:hypothetical protein